MPTAGHLALRLRGKTFLAIEPVDAIDPGRLSIPPKQDEQSTIAKPAALISQIAQLRSQLNLRRSRISITDRLSVRGYNLSGPPFRQAHDGLQVRDSVTLSGRPYHFSRESREVRQHPASVPRVISSAWHSLPPALHTLGLRHLHAAVLAFQL